MSCVAARQSGTTSTRCRRCGTFTSPAALIMAPITMIGPPGTKWRGRTSIGSGWRLLMTTRTWVVASLSARTPDTSTTPSASRRLKKWSYCRRPGFIRWKSFAPRHFTALKPCSSPKGSPYSLASFVPGFLLTWSSCRRTPSQTSKFSTARGPFA